MRAVILALALLPLVALPAGAGELKGVTVPDTLTLDGERMVLNGMALRKVAIVSVYVAAFYLPAEQGDAEAILAADTLRHLQMHWLRGAGKEKVCEGWYDGLEANTPNASAQLKSQFDTLCEAMEEASKGMVIAFTYRPDAGTEVKIDDRVKGVIEGKEFADALWRCWIGPDPGPGQKFKQDLLGG